ncbi:hypothetical protein FB458_1531 [Lapillicoccus jejuensis]|uniref:Uncharacterized protein n=1 Tax=Lapillicoccus jejuensis TaxID=402171 RepID=A0A542DZD0_9MICO|nr:hypothetical protein FB458_1531 [Lapillicoccus jejuensis]
MHIKALVARTNVVLPPPSGPARIQHCIHQGLDELVKARTAMWTAELKLKRALSAPGVAGLLPDGKALLAGPTGAFVRHAGRKRVEQWFSLRERAFDHFTDEYLRLNRQPYADFCAAGMLIQEVLAASGRGYLWLIDAAIDADPQAKVSLGHQEPLLLDLIDEIHTLLHRSGEIRGGLYGCELKYDKGRWFQECLVHLPHVPLANSMGFTCRYICSICQEDASTCRHISGQNYDVRVVKDARGVCNVCRFSTEGCQHTQGQVLNVRASVMITDVELREISLVKRARDPLARISAIEKDASELLALFGYPPSPDDLVLCHTCMYPCQHRRTPNLPQNFVT